MAAPERYASYTVYERIGKGGMATVHRAEQQLKDGSTRQVALKRLIPTIEKERVALFLDEAKLIRNLHHPNIAETFDAGRHFGTYFIAMEYVGGPSLKDLVQQVGATVGAVPQPIVLVLAAQLCDALDHAHGACDADGLAFGIVHRDVSPANILLSEAGVLKLIDFGLAKAKGFGEDTGKNVIKGKYAYVAPEYLGGELDMRADLWAVGIILYELLTSRRLFDGHDAFETIARVRGLPIPRPSLGNPRVTPELDRIVMTALERDPTRRWQSAAEMRDALRDVITKGGVSIEPRHVAEWVRWVFAQTAGTDASGDAQLEEIAGPPMPVAAQPVTLPSPRPATTIVPARPSEQAIPERLAQAVSAGGERIAQAVAAGGERRIWIVLAVVGALVFIALLWSAAS